jgi:hypothetical protein
MLKFFRIIRKKLIEYPSMGRAGDKVRKPATPAGTSSTPSAKSCWL